MRLAAEAVRLAAEAIHLAAEAKRLAAESICLAAEAIHVFPPIIIPPQQNLFSVVLGCWLGCGNKY